MLVAIESRSSRASQHSDADIDDDDAVIPKTFIIIIVVVAAAL
jgi:hypothetical protein